MMESTYGSCLFYTDGSNKSFEIEGLQSDNTLILANDTFAATKEKGLKEAKLLAKDREKLTLNSPIKFNGGYIKLADDNRLFLVKKSSANAYIW